MRAIVFNLLQAQAQASDCEHEAWEIVTEFAAAEALLERVCEPDARTSNDEMRRQAGFIAAAEALLGCIGNATRGIDFFDDDELDDNDFGPRPSACPEPD